ncbi:MAG: IS21 family transposase [Candidatus Dormibacteraceae bacterium]
MKSGEANMELKALHRHGWAVTDLAREFGLSRTTVYRELASQGPRGYAEREQPTMLTEPQQIHVERRLAVCASIRGTDLHAELRRDYGYEGSYPAFQRRLRVLRPAQIRDPEIRFETDPGRQTQTDWALLGLFPLGEGMVELNALVSILGCSRAPAIRFATDRTRTTTLERLFRCIDDLGGATREILTDRDPAFCIGQDREGGAILSPEWVDFATLLGVVPRACRPYRAQTKGKVERMVRELKEGFLPWLSGQLLPARPTLADYDTFARRWIQEVVLQRRHRTTKLVVGEAWLNETSQLAAIPDRVRAKFSAKLITLPAPATTAGQRSLGQVVQLRDLSEYEALAR